MPKTLFQNVIFTLMMSFLYGLRHDLLQYLPECGRNEQRSIPDGFRRTENHVAGCLRSGICFR